MAETAPIPLPTTSDQGGGTAPRTAARRRISPIRPSPPADLEKGLLRLAQLLAKNHAFDTEAPRGSYLNIRV